MTENKKMNKVVLLLKKKSTKPLNLWGFPSTDENLVPVRD